MLFASNKPVRVVALSSYTIQSGNRKGETVNRCSISDDNEVIDDINLDDKIDVSAIKKYIQEYDILFEYTIRKFNNNLYTQVAIASILPHTVKSDTKS